MENSNRIRIVHKQKIRKSEKVVSTEENPDTKKFTDVTLEDPNMEEQNVTFESNSEQTKNISENSIASHQSIVEREKTSEDAIEVSQENHNLRTSNITGLKGPFVIKTQDEKSDRMEEEKQSQVTMVTPGGDSQTATLVKTEMRNKGGESGYTSFKDFVLRSFDKKKISNDKVEVKKETPTKDHTTGNNMIKERKKEKINAIIEKAVKRALLHNKLKQEPTKKAQFNRSYDPILNPVTGRPLGLVQKETGHFYPVRQGEMREDKDSEGEGDANKKYVPSSTANLVMYPADVGRSEQLSDDNGSQLGLNLVPSRNVIRRQLHVGDSRTQIDPSLDSLTREFLYLMQGERSAINSPYR